MASFDQLQSTDYQAVPAGSSAVPLTGQNGQGLKGDVLQRLVVNVATTATSTVSIQDGSGSSIAIVPASTPVGVYSILIGAKSQNGAWKVTTGAGASVVAIGRFQ